MDIVCTKCIHVNTIKLCSNDSWFNLKEARILFPECSNSKVGKCDERLGYYKYIQFSQHTFILDI